MPKLIITCGLSGSGKSTYAESLVKTGFVEINRDTVRFDHYCKGVQDWGLYKFTKERETYVSKVCWQDWRTWVEFGNNVVVSDCNLDKKYHEYWENLAEEAGYDFEVKYFDMSLEEAYKRDLRRGGKAVGRDVLNRQWKQWLKITGRRVYEPDTNLPTAVVSDVDGTVAEMYNRSPYDWDRVGQDYPRLEIIKIIESYVKAGSHQLIFVSGRDGSCYNETRKWLTKYVSIPFQLYMRHEGDTTKDTLVKEEIVFNKLEPSFNIVAWFDDRPCVIRKIKDLGIQVCDVSRGYDEF